MSPLRARLRVFFARHRWLLPALLLAALLCGPAAPQPRLSASAASLALYFPPSPGRHFYLTGSEYAADSATTACSTGYHMASLWELYDPSNLIYDHAHPAAEVKSDSGYGPPAGWNGWVRTGSDSSGSATPGAGNCLSWTSASSSVYGVTIRLSTSWESAPGEIGPWDSTSFPCNYFGPVWCVGDFFTVYLPVIIKSP